MTHRLRSLFVLAAVGSVLLAGCGSSSKKSSTTASAPTTASTASTPASTSAATKTTGAGTTTSGGGASTTASVPSSVSNSPAVKAAVASCKTTINKQPLLSATDKAKLGQLCDKAATGNVGDITKVEAEVCQDAVKDSVPAAEQSTAMAACPKG